MREERVKSDKCERRHGESDSATISIQRPRYREEWQQHCTREGRGKVPPQWLSLGGGGGGGGQGEMYCDIDKLGNVITVAVDTPQR